jgi:hypothetical protein
VGRQLRFAQKSFIAWSMAPNRSVEVLDMNDVGNFGRSESDRPVHHGMSL